MKLLPTRRGLEFDLSPFIDVVNAVPDDPVEEEKDNESPELSSSVADSTPADLHPATEQGAGADDSETTAASPDTADDFGVGLHDQESTDSSATEFASTGVADREVPEPGISDDCDSAGSDPREHGHQKATAGRTGRRRGQRRRDRRRTKDKQNEPQSDSESTTISGDTVSPESESGAEKTEPAASSIEGSSKPRSRNRRRGRRRRGRGQGDSGPSPPESS
jgi:hypothetical protein